MLYLKFLCMGGKDQTSELAQKYYWKQLLRICFLTLGQLVPVKVKYLSFLVDALLWKRNLVYKINMTACQLSCS